MTTISAVVPTFRRREALLSALPNHLALDGVDEVVVVDDGSPDGTADAVEALGLPRVRVVRHDRNRGLPAARNTGARAASGAWILYLEDDCGFPPDYATVLLNEALRHKADIVGAPWVHTPDNAEARSAAERPQAEISLLSPPWVHPPKALETPFMPALSLIRREVFEQVQYDESYRGNFFREETDFYVSARRRGFRVLLTPRTASWQLGRWAGGCKGRSRVRDDVWATRNTWRLLRRHGTWLRRAGLLDQTNLVVLARVAWPRLRYYLVRPWRALRWLVRQGRRAAAR